MTFFVVKQNIYYSFANFPKWKDLYKYLYTDLRYLIYKYVDPIIVKYLISDGIIYACFTKKYICPIKEIHLEILNKKNKNNISCYFNERSVFNDVVHSYGINLCHPYFSLRKNGKYYMKKNTNLNFSVFLVFTYNDLKKCISDKRMTSNSNRVEDKIIELTTFGECYLP
jgi:hypothetical protein